MEWQLAKLNDDETIFGSKTKGKYWVKSFDQDSGLEMSGEFFETMEEAMDSLAAIEDDIHLTKERSI